MTKKRCEGRESIDSMGSGRTTTTGTMADCSLSPWVVSGRADRHGRRKKKRLSLGAREGPRRHANLRPPSPARIKPPSPPPHRRLASSPAVPDRLSRPRHAPPLPSWAAFPRSTFHGDPQACDVVCALTRWSAKRSAHCVSPTARCSHHPQALHTQRPAKEYLRV